MKFCASRHEVVIHIGLDAPRGIRSTKSSQAVGRHIALEEGQRAVNVSEDCRLGS